MNEKTIEKISDFGTYDFKENQKQIKDINDRLKRLVDLGNLGKTKNPGQPPVKPSPKMDFLTPENIEKIIKKELNNFEIIDMTNRAVILPTSMIPYLLSEPSGDRTIELLQQLSRIYPSALYIRQVQHFDDSGEIKNHYPSTWDYKETK